MSMQASVSSMVELVLLYYTGYLSEVIVSVVQAWRTAVEVAKTSFSETFHPVCGRFILGGSFETFPST